MFNLNLKQTNKMILLKVLYLCLNIDIMKIDRSQSVYVVFNPDTKRTKIGISENVKNRLSTLIADSGCRLELIYNTRHILSADKYEAKIHEKLKDYKYLGEWFTIDPLKAKDMVIKETDNAPIDIIVDQYRNGMDVYELTKIHKMSRSGIVKHLKQSNEWGKKIKKNIFEFGENVFKNDTSKSDNKPTNKTMGVNNQYNKRVCANVYTNNAQDKYVYRVFKGGAFIELEFDTLDSCMFYLEKNNR